MATRGDLNKLGVQALKILASEKNIATEKKKKNELVSQILDAQAPVSALTPILSQSAGADPIAFSPNFKENLPPFNRVTYVSELTKLPNIKFNDIYEFMILRPTDAGGSVNNFRGLDRATKHYDAGDIQGVSVAQVDESIVYVRATCQASMKKMCYQVYVCASLSPDKDHDKLEYAYCQCPIGLSQACSHIGAFLFALANGQTTKVEEESCTSNLCMWKVPRNQAKAQPLSSFQLAKPRITPSSLTPNTVQPPPQSTFDPRHSEDRSHDLHNSLKELRKLKEVFPQTGMSHLWNIPDHVPYVCQEVEMQTSIHPLQEKMEQMVFNENNCPPPSIDQDLSKYIEENTQRQTLCPMWKALHRGRITSSIFGDVLHAGPNPASLIKQIVEGSSLDKYSNLPEAVKWGQDHEGCARVQYGEIRRAISNVQIHPTGLTLCTSHSFLGASSDGRVLEQDGEGLLEIKCPFSLNGKPLHSMEIGQIMAMNSKSFCLESSSEGLQLKKCHKYYAQVQGEMAIMGLPWCDFVVWTGAPSNNIAIDRVYFDADFVSNMMPKLVNFFLTHIYPLYYP